MRLTMLAVCACIVSLSSVSNIASGASQLSIPRVDLMPNAPSPYIMRDWKKVTRDYDAFIFDFNKTGPYLPLIWWDNTKINFPRTGFGMPSYVGRYGQGSANGHESINCMGAVIGATLSGIDKSSQNGYNWVLMQENYFNSANGQNLYLNNIGGITGQTYWYEVLPSVLFYQLNYLYPDTGNFAAEFTTTADRWYDACAAMGGKTSPWTVPNFYYTAFNFSTMAGVYNGVWRENDAAAAIGWVEYMAYVKTGNAKYLAAARWCVEYLLAQTSNPNYDVVLVYAPILAMRLNAEQGFNYDVQKLINWCFDGNQWQWGVMVDSWNGLDVHGLMGSGSSNYIFEMETMQMAQSFLPLARYDQRYARAMGKYLLHVANNSRLFYSNAHDEAHQSSYAWASVYDPCACIGYEGLKKSRIRYAHAGADYGTSYGSIISGNYSKTAAKDKVYEVLQEGPTSANNQLEHIWSFTLDTDPARWKKLVINGHIEKLGVDGDTGFNMYWSTSPTGPWNSMFTINSSTDKDYWIDGDWAGGTGQLYIRASDNYKTGRGEMDKLYIDEIWIECKNDSVSPYASGDPLSFGWGETDLGLYGSSYVGVLGGIVSTTNVEKILQLDMLATDYYHAAAYPTYLYYNPYAAAQAVTVDVGTSPVDIYDMVSQGMLKVDVTGPVDITIPADSAIEIVLAPAGGKVTIEGGKKYINGVLVDNMANATYANCEQIQASPNRLAGDINGDCTVDMLDMAAAAHGWLNTGEALGRSDINGDQKIDLGDFAALARQWYLAN